MTPKRPRDNTSEMTKIGKLFTEIHNRYHAIYREAYTSNSPGANNQGIRKHSSVYSDPTPATALDPKKVKQRRALAQHNQAMLIIYTMLREDNKRLRNSWSEPSDNQLCQHCFDYRTFRYGRCAKCYNWKVQHGEERPL